MRKNRPKKAEGRGGMKRREAKEVKEEKGGGK